MNCRRVEQLLSDHLERLVSEREARAIEAHMGHCPACRRRQDQFLAVRAGLRELAQRLPTRESDVYGQAVGRWMAEREGSNRSWERGLRAPFLATIPVHPRGLAALAVPAARLISLGSAAAAFLLCVLTFYWWGHGRVAGPHPHRFAQRPHPTPTVQGLSPTAPPAGKVRGNPIAMLPPASPTELNEARRSPVPPPGGGNRETAKDHQPRPSPLRPYSPAVGDLAYVNRDPKASLQQWMVLPQDAWGRIEARARRGIQVRDDFVTVPFSRIASTSDRPIAQAVDNYQREAAIVDPRLAREVTCAFKATALSDLCDQFRSDTGIHLAAGNSVADEKVTVFCENMPLRDVMRQLSRPFGYTWLRSKREGGKYRYELVQDLKSQLLEEELRNRDRNAALIDLERGMERYRPYLSLSSDEALAKSKTAPAAEKPLLEKLAGEGWGPIHLYFQLSPQEQAALRAGQKLKFGQEPEDDQLPLLPEMARAVLQSARHLRLTRREGQLRHAGPDDADAIPLTAVPEARALVNLSLSQSELGRFTLEGNSGFRISGGRMMASTGSGPYAIGISPTVRQPDNAAANAAFAQDPLLKPSVTVKPLRHSGPSDLSQDKRAAPPETRASQPAPQDAKVTPADVLEALHRATGMPVVSDFYTRLYPPESVTVKERPRFDALNQLADTMHLRWHKEAGWLQFRSASFYDDRLKEVPNRLLARWAAARREHGELALEALIEIAQLSDQQLDAANMAEGAQELWGLKEWDLARGGTPRPHLRFLATLTPAQRQAALSASPSPSGQVPGLAFTQLSLAQQQQFITLAFMYSMKAPDVRLERLAAGGLRVAYSRPGGFEWRLGGRPGGPERPASGLALVWAPTRAAALQMARRGDPQVEPEEIMPSERALTFLYDRGDPSLRGQVIVVRATNTYSTIW